MRPVERGSGAVSCGDEAVQVAPSGLAGLGGAPEGGHRRTVAGRLDHLTAAATVSSKSEGPAARLPAREHAPIPLL
jgi:hypothetical protein